MLDIFIRSRIPSDMNLDYGSDIVRASSSPSSKIRIEFGSDFWRILTSLAFLKDEANFRAKSAKSKYNAELF